jgi:hypothetical protein
VIINDAASLKSGVAIWKELQHGHNSPRAGAAYSRTGSSTRSVGWVRGIPLQYRMAEWENVCVNDSTYTAGLIAPASARRPSNGGALTSLQSVRWKLAAPVWPNDKHVSLEEAFHFAACCQRIGRVAKEAQNHSSDSALGNAGAVELTENGGILPTESLVSQHTVKVMEVWKALATTDGFTGMLFVLVRLFPSFYVLSPNPTVILWGGSLERSSTGCRSQAGF